jgi:hypothetical protein
MPIVIRPASNGPAGRGGAANAFKIESDHPWSPTASDTKMPKTGAK